MAVNTGVKSWLIVVGGLFLLSCVCSRLSVAALCAAGLHCAVPFD